MNNFEITLVRYIHRFGKGRIDLLTSFISRRDTLAVMWAIFLVIAYFYFPADKNILLGRVVIVAILYFIISEGFFKHFLSKFLKIRKRPFVSYPDEIAPIGYQFSDSSMPSSHMANTVSMAMVFYSVFPMLALPGVVLVVFMGFARIHNGMHYPSDVIAGTVVGIIYGMVALLMV